MTFAEAQHFIMPFGQHCRKTLDEIAESDEGLRYLDWLRGERNKPQPDHGQRFDPLDRPFTACVGGPLDRALAAYLDDPRTKGDLRRLLEDEE